jgi:hypothetical protein
MTSLDHSLTHVLNKQEKYLMCKCKDPFKKELFGIGQESKCECIL